MSEQLDLSDDIGWRRSETPKEIIDKPELHLVWRGLQISISAGQLTKKQAREMLDRWSKDAPETNTLEECNPI